MILRRLIVVCSFLICSFSFAAVQDSIGTIQEEGKIFIEYMVSPGETIYRISTNHGVSISDLMAINPDLENGLKVGQLIKIPYKAAYIQDQKDQKETQKKIVEQAKSDGTHTVAPGETFYSLSKKYGVSVDELLKWNDMTLKSGQTIYVSSPEKATVSNEAKIIEPIHKVVETKKVDSASKQKPTPKPVVNVVVKELPSVQKDEQAKTTTKIDAAKAKSQIVTVEEEFEEKPFASTSQKKYEYNPNFKQVLIVPFDPHLYFSDADDEIAQTSRIPRTQVRQVFRRRLNALLDPKGYETIHLMGGKFADTLVDLNKIYGSVSYNYQEILNSEYNRTQEEALPQKSESKVAGWVSSQSKKIKNTNTETLDHTYNDKFEGKFFGVKVRDAQFFEYFSQKYSVDYYVFINQFEVITDYEHCLDRAAQNYQRYFVTHYSIFNKDGVQIAGNKYKVYYDSNSNDVNRIVADNMQKISQRILNDLPAPGSKDY